MYLPQKTITSLEFDKIRAMLADCAMTEGAKAAAFRLGVKEGIDPFMTLSFMALPVIPTRGIIDVVTQQYM